VLKIFIITVPFFALMVSTAAAFVTFSLAVGLLT